MEQVHKVALCGAGKKKSGVKRRRTELDELHPIKGSRPVAAAAFGTSETESNNQGMAITEENPTCFICLESFQESEDLRCSVPCANKCNRAPVHATCIYEWSQTKASCPLCRGAMRSVRFVPDDRNHGIVSKRSALDFMSRPVAKGQGPARCYVRAVRSPLTSSTVYDLYLQAPTTLAYPLGPIPSESPRQGDVLLATAERSINQEGQSLVRMTCASNESLGTITGSPGGLEHTISGACGDELGAVRFSQNSAGRAAGPKRILVCLPSVACQDKEMEWTTLPYHASQDVAGLQQVLRQLCDGGRAGASKGRTLFGWNKAPFWLPSIQAFSLDFGGRVTLPSNKNFQLMTSSGEKSCFALQFGKVCESEACQVFTMDVAWPLSPLQAFGISLLSCDALP